MNPDRVNVLSAIGSLELAVPVCASELPVTSATNPIITANSSIRGRYGADRCTLPRLIIVVLPLLVAASVFHDAGVANTPQLIKLISVTNITQASPSAR